MATTRTYAEACGIPRALDRVGERWALMIVRELMLGPKRFTDLKTGLPHASPNVLSQRLRELEEEGVVQKRRLPPPYASKVYELTDWGRELEPVLLALGTWGARAPMGPPEHGMSVDSHILSLKTLFDPDLAGDFHTSVQLHLDEHDFGVVIADGRLEATRGELSSPDVSIRTDPGTLIALAHGRVELDEALASGEVAIEGDKATVVRFLGLFPLPEPALVQA